MAILMEKDYWLNSQLSVARFYGGIRLNGEDYHVKPPKDDLVMASFEKHYEKLGREKFIEILEQHPTAGKTAMLVHMNAALAHQKEIKQSRKQESKELSLFDENKLV